MVIDRDEIDALRHKLVKNGYRPVPVLTNQKRPLAIAWTKTAREGGLPAFNPSAANTGILCDGLRVIDIDIDDETISANVFDMAISRFGETIERCRANSHRRSLVYRAAIGEPHKASVDGTAGKVEVLGYGQQFVAFGGHPSGAQLEWRINGPHDMKVMHLPAIEEGEVAEFLADVAPIIGHKPRIVSQSMSPAGDRPSASYDGETSIDEIEELLGHIPPDVGYAEWLEVLMALHAATGGSADGFMLADAWSSRGGSLYKGTADVAAKWRSFKSGGVSGRTLAARAQAHGANLSEIAIKHKVPEYDPVEAQLAADRLWATIWRDKPDPGVRKAVEQVDGTLTDADTGEVIEVITPKEAKQPEGGKFPPGLVGSIAKWIVATARRKQPELAIGAALAIVGTLAGRQFIGPTDSATHLYILGLAPTGTGKDHALQQIGRLMTAAKLAHHIGPSEFISMPAVVNFLMRKPLSVCAMDEFGGFMKRINGRNASGFESAISKILRTMWSSSFVPYQTPEWAQKQSEIIHSPAMSIYGASTPEQFYSAMEGAAVEDGTLNRFLLISGQDQVPEIEPEKDKAMVPPDMIIDMSAIYYRSGMTTTTWRNDPHADPASDGVVVNLKWCADGSRGRYMDFSEAMNQQSRHPEHGAFYARTAEMAVRVATIIAIGRLDDMQVRMSDLDYGIEIAIQSANIMRGGAADWMSENETQANGQRIIRAIKRRGGRCTRRELVAALNGVMRARDMNDTLAMLCEGGIIEKLEVKNAKGPASTRYQIAT